MLEIPFALIGGQLLRELSLFLNPLLVSVVFLTSQILASGS